MIVGNAFPGLDTLDEPASAGFVVRQCVRSLDVAGTLDTTNGGRRAG
jgi:hypothetical protein